MPGELTALTGHLLGYLLAVVRTGAVMVTVPLPALRQAPDLAKTGFALLFALIVYPAWRHPEPSLTFGELLAAAGREFLIGCLLGLLAGMIIDTVVISAHLVGYGAGFSYASTVDPTSQADSSVLEAIAQLAAVTLFLATGLERQLIHALALPTPMRMSSSMDAVLAAGTAMWNTAFRLALPILTLLLLVDLAIALFGRVQAQLQLLTVALSVKIVVTLGLLSLVCVSWRQVFEGRSLMGP